jgi:VWFA-related protein
MKDGRRKKEDGKYFLSSVFFLLSFTLLQQPPRFRGGVEIVQLDVAVLDKQRRPITGLTADDFTVLENGQPQPIVAFEELSAPDPDGSVVPWMRDIAPDVRTNSADGHRVFALVLDDVSIAGGIDELRVVDTVKQIARAFVMRMGPLDQACVVFTGDNHLAQDFTDDHRALLAVIDKFHGTMVPPFLRGLYPASVVGRAAQSLIEVSHRRKAMIYIGAGIKIPGPEFAQFGLQSSNENASASQQRAEVEGAILQAQRANVSIYTINPRGLEAFTDEDARRESNDVNDGLYSVANATGGFAVTNTNSFAGQVAQIFTETGSYYLIGFRSAYTDGKFRRLNVKVNRPGVSVRTRNGYVAPKGEKPGKEAPPIFKAIAGVLPMPDLYVRAAVAPFATPDRKLGAVAIALGLTQPPGINQPLTQVIDVTANAFTREGKPLAGRRQTVQLKLRPVEATEDSRFEVLTRLDLKPGLYNLRFGVHSATSGKSGSVYVDVEVPNFEKERLALSGAVITVAPAMISGGADVLKDVLPQIPTTQRVFGQEEEATVFLRVYQGGNKPVVPAMLRASVKDAADKTVFSAEHLLPAAVFSAARESDYRLGLPLKALSPGPYLLTIDGSLDEKTHVTRLVRFSAR